MPITNRSEAKEGGFAQVREALQKFKGDVVSAEFGQWGGKLIDDDGKPVPPREYLEISCTNLEVLEVTEELSMDITDWNFRVNCSDFNGSFWVERFLEATDKLKILVPDGLVNKTITWQKVTLEATDPKYNSTNFIPVSMENAKAPAKPAPKVVNKVAPKPVAKTAPPVEEEAPAEEEPVNEADPMAVALEVAVGKTEQQFRSAIALNPAFANSPLLPLAKAGSVTGALVNEGKLILVKEGNKEVYRKPE